MLHAKCRIRYATLPSCKKQTVLGIRADGISLVSLFNQGPASVTSFGELFSISNRLSILVAEASDGHWLVLASSLAFADTSTLTMRLETFSIGQDRQNEAGTHFSQPFPLPYDPIPARKCETPAVRTYPSIPHTPAPFQRRSRVRFRCEVFVYALLSSCSSSRVSVRFVVGT